MQLHSIIVKARLDTDAGVWVASSDDLPGLVTEAETLELLEKKLHDVIIDLVEMNGLDDSNQVPDEIPLFIMHEQVSRVRLRA
jgi:predicted RNase H-like HicB family nuclease